MLRRKKKHWGDAIKKLPTHSVCVLQPPQVDVLHRRLEGAQTVAEFIFTGVAEAEVPDVAQVCHPEDKHRNNSARKLLTRIPFTDRSLSLSSLHADGKSGEVS